MAQVNIQQVKELRERTQAGLNDCRSALMEAEGDMEKAVEVILKKGLAKSAKRAGKIASEGVVAAKVADDGKTGVVVEVNIQTDFAARNPDFVAFVDQVVAAALAAAPGADLSSAPYPGGSGSVEDNRQALVGKLGENISVRRWERVTVDGAGKVHAYVHMGGKIAVLLAARAGDEAAAGKPEFLEFVDNVAMQVAAMSPQWLAPSDVPEAAEQKQTEIFEGQLKEEGKVPEAKWPHVVKGKLAKWKKEVCLREQQSVIDTDKNIDQVTAAVAEAVGTSVVLQSFVRFEKGEGIEKSQGPDFAEEVAKMAGGN
jgi:elongation factor Ts